MTAHDPFDALRAETTPIDPPPDVATRLRRRLGDHLLHDDRYDPEDPMTNHDNNHHDDRRGNDHGHARSVTPYLVVADAAAAIDFYVAAFGAVEQHRLVGDDGRVGHAQIIIGDSVLMLADEHPEFDTYGPLSRGGPTTNFTVDVGDVGAVDVAFARAVQLGATAVRPPEDQFYGYRSGTVRDPFGHQWNLSAPVAGFDDEQFEANSNRLGYQVRRPTQQPAATAAETAHVSAHQLKRYDRGDLYYFTLPVADLPKAQAFFGELLGWQFDGPEAGHVSSINAPTGGPRAGGPAAAELWFVVDDIDTAVERVRRLGGTASDPVHYDSGWDSTCTDDQGTEFHLSVPADQYRLH